LVPQITPPFTSYPIVITTTTTIILVCAPQMSENTCYLAFWSWPISFTWWTPPSSTHFPAND
jgi:hypothetical protein